MEKSCPSESKGMLFLSTWINRNNLPIFSTLCNLRVLRASVVNPAIVLSEQHRFRFAAGSLTRWGPSVCQRSTGNNRSEEFSTRTPD